MKRRTQGIGIIQGSGDLTQFSLALRVLLLEVSAPLDPFSLISGVFFLNNWNLSSHSYQEIIKTGSEGKTVHNKGKEKQKGTNQHWLPPIQKRDVEVSLDSNMQETKPFLGWKHPAISAGWPSHPPKPDEENR
jgi:hypothetical protein